MQYETRSQSDKELKNKVKITKKIIWYVEWNHYVKNRLKDTYLCFEMSTITISKTFK